MTTASRNHASAPIAILTDFGYRDHYAGVLSGVVARIAPNARVIDLSHGIPPQSITAGALVLAHSWRFFPDRTIFLAVVDPGVGTERLPIAIASRAGARFVGPDNGVLMLAAQAAGIQRAVVLESARYRLPATSATFHGRDIFAPAAAWLARGVAITSLGRALPKPQPLKLPEPEESARQVQGEVIYVDGFGNLVTNISGASVVRMKARFREKSLSVRIEKGAAMNLYRSYADAPVNSPLATIGSFDFLEIAVRDSSAERRLGCGVGARVTLSPRG